MGEQVITGRISYGPMTGDTGNASFTLSPGMDPSAAIIECGAFDDTLPPVGDLVFSGTFGEWRLTGCALLTPQIVFGPPPLVRYTIVDRRWRWKEGGGIFRGRFNWRRDATRGTPYGKENVEPLDNPKSPRELAAILFRELGEPNADVSQIPDMPRSEWPFFEWDHIPTRMCLGQLLDAIRCWPIIGVDDVARVLVPGRGDSLDLDEFSADESHGTTPLVRPDALLFVGSPTIHEALIAAEPVLKDLDGLWKPINEVSYKPSDGWENADLDGRNVESDFDVTKYPDEFDQKRATATATAYAQQIWSAYRLLPKFADGTSTIEGHIEEFHPSKAVLLPTLIGKEFDAVSGLEVDREPYAEGEFYDLQHYVGNTDPGTRFRGTMAIDADNRVVTFSDPLYRLGPDGTYEPARIFIRVAFYYWEGETRIVRRFVDKLTMPGRTYGTGAALVMREDVEYRIYAKYNPPETAGEDYTAAGLAENKDAVQAAADYYLDATARGYAVSRTKGQKAIGLHKIEPNGKIPQVAWSTAAGVPETTAGEGMEHDTTIPPYRLRRRQERVSDRERASIDDAMVSRQIINGIRKK